MNENREKEKKAAIEYFKSVEELKNERKNKFIYILAIILFILVAIKLILGEIVISLPFEYKDNRLYEVYLNDIDMTVEVEDEKKITVIPYFLSFVQRYHGVYTGTLDIYEDIEESPCYKLKINSYNCYAEMPSLEENEKINYKISCNTEQEYIKELNNDTVYKLYIKRTHKGKETILYDGDFIEDITEYIVDRGRYLIMITGNYKNVESKIYVSFDKE